MKKSLVLLGFIFCFAISLQAQTSVDTCNERTERTELKFKDVRYFQTQGIDLTDYKWDNADANCHVNLMVKEYHKYTKNKWNRWTGAAFTVLCIPLGIASNNAGEQGTAGLYFACAAVSTTISVVSFVETPKHKEKLYYHMQEVNDYYKMKGL